VLYRRGKAATRRGAEKRISFAFASLVLLAFAQTLAAQRLNIRSYAPEDGLVGAPVWRIFQDERSVMWFATDGGVSAYDGVSFRNLTVEDGLPSGVVQLLDRAPDGSLWIGTGTGLARYDGTSLKTIANAEGRWAATLDGQGNAWSGDVRGIFVFDGRTTRLIDKPPELTNEEVYSVTPAGQSIWIGRRESGVVEMRMNGTKLLGVHALRPDDGLAHPTVRAVVRDARGWMYFGTRGSGVSRFDGKSFATFDTRHGLPSNDIYSLLITRDGQIVVGTIEHGLAICTLPDFARCRTINVENGLHARSVFSLYEDREGNLWIGLVNGVSKLMSLHAESFTEQEGLPSDNIYSVLPEPNGELWVGTLGGLAHRKKNGEWITYDAEDGLPSSEVRDVLRDGEGRLWIGTARGLCTTEDPDRGFRCLTGAGKWGDYVIDLARSRTGDILMGTSGAGLSRVSLDAGRELRVRPIGLSAGVTSIMEDAAGRVWVATSGGGLYRHDKDGAMARFVTAQGLGNDDVRAVYVDPLGVVWAGTHGGGLSYLRPGMTRFLPIGPGRGLDATSIAAIVQDASGKLWLGTNRGLYQIDPATVDARDKPFVLQWLDERDGLISREVISSNALAFDEEGRVWAGFLRGLTQYDPSRRVPNKIAPAAMIVRAAINGHMAHAPFTTVSREPNVLPWPGSSPLRLTHRQNNLRFEFRGLSFRDEGDVRFRYKLEGFDPDWSAPVDQPFKEYTNLDAGSYRFVVIAANGDGVWSPVPASFGFTILPPYWKTTTFRLLAVAILLSAILAVHKLRLRHVEQRNRELELTVTARTEELRGHTLELEDRVRKRTSELAHQALHDVLTGLPNRNLLMDRLEQAIARGKRRPDLFAVLFLDLDRFKVVNDSLGHTAGDQFLIGTARRLEASIRPGDTVSRLGGDEFVILLDQITSTDDALAIVKRMQQKLAEPFTVSGHEIYSTASIGVTVSSIGYERAESILRDADIAMYRAKLRGRARYEVFDESMRADARAVMELETDLRRAVERNEFSVLYQPIVALQPGRLVGFEALVRWEHPTRGRTAPAEFLPLADETGLIVAIDRLVLTETCRQLRRWSDQFPSRALHVSVNLSSRQFRRDDFVSAVAANLDREQLPKKSLGLEITEGTIMERGDRAVEIVTELRQRGVRWSIDDFGTGYSSLSYLHRFPVDTLKIDQSFVRRIGQQAESTEIIRTIMTLAESLGMSVVAEGIETLEQLTNLRSRGCEFGQGYYFSHPIDAPEATALIDENRQWDGG